MEIKYTDKREDLKTAYNDYLNVINNYRKVLMGKKINYYKSIIKANYIKFAWCTIAFLLFALLYLANTEKVFSFFLLLGTVVYFFAILYVLGIIKNYKKQFAKMENEDNNFKGTITIDDNGIRDVIRGIEVSYTWDNLKTLIETDYNIFIINKYERITFYFPKEVGEKVKSAIKEYNKDFNIINYNDYVLNIK